MSVIQANGINIHYWRVGEGPDLVMLHGLLGNLAIWHLRMVPAAREYFRVTTYDLRGHGRTDIPPTGYTTAHHVADLLGLLDALEMNRVNLVGHSLGADVALHFALRHPGRVGRMVLLEPAIPALAYLRRDEDWPGWRYWRELLEEYAHVQVPPDKRTDIRFLAKESIKAPIVYGPAQGRPRKAEPILQLLDNTTVIEDYDIVEDLTLENLGRIPHPKLLIYDSDSPYMGTFQIIRELVVNSTEVVLPPAEHRHFSPLEQPEVLLNYVLPFLRGEDVRPRD